ncbi:hypothetical protein NKY70_29990 [Sinorhizobium meliloti]|uniref:hypothetical protein n=1 Tax=Rhizobium meliloti TaxID=382 RepID=UPI0029B6AF7D|nr:hypothetical protein [Sinorhizobium meliloti]
MWFYAFSVLPLAEVYAIVFCTPIVVTLASIPVLGEKVGIHRFSAVLLGFVGILIMINPVSTHFTFAHLSAFGSVIASTAVILIMRKVGTDGLRGSLRRLVKEKRRLGDSKSRIASACSVPICGTPLRKGIFQRFITRGTGRSYVRPISAALWTAGLDESLRDE